MMENTQFTQSDVYGTHEEKATIVEPVQVQQPVVVQLTPKKYKLWMLIGILMVFGSIVGGFFALTTSQPVLALLAVYPFFGGFIIYGVAKFLAWWNNG